MCALVYVHGINKNKHCNPLQSSLTIQYWRLETGSEVVESGLKVMPPADLIEFYFNGAHFQNLNLNQYLFDVGLFCEFRNVFQPVCSAQIYHNRILPLPFRL